VDFHRSPWGGVGGACPASIGGLVSGILLITFRYENNCTAISLKCLQTIESCTYLYKFNLTLSILYFLYVIKVE